MFRLFVAIEIPDPVKAQLAGLQNGLPGARWRPDEVLHLTLAFIGDTDRHGFEDAVDALAGIDAPAFSLTLADVGYFGDRKPRAVWAGVKREDALLHLQDKVEAALRRYGFELERRKFTPHVTLAYLKRANVMEVKTYCAVNGGFTSPSFAVKEFSLFSSQMGGDFSHYEIEARYSLSSSR